MYLFLLPVIFREYLNKHITKLILMKVYLVLLNETIYMFKRCQYNFFYETFRLYRNRLTAEVWGMKAFSSVSIPLKKKSDDFFLTHYSQETKMKLNKYFVII